MKNFKSGKYKQQNQYKSFTPSFINHKFVWDDKEVDVLIEKAMHYLGELNAYSNLVLDVDFFIQMHVAKEATRSSMIEGTKTNIDEAVLGPEDIKPEQRDDWEEVQNYIKALNSSIEMLDKLPLSIRLVKKSHKILLSGVRGKHKLPGQIRRSQNWIGGSDLSDAFFIPPHNEDLPDLLSDFDKFWNNDNLELSTLIKIAISHYQFETIHPFLDGNGRIGRLLITLQLIDSGILSKPTLYLSDFFEKNRVSYYDSLTRVRVSNDLEQWIKFFLNGVVKTAQDSIAIFNEINKLRSEYVKQIDKIGIRSKKAYQLLEYMFSRPIVNNKKIMKELGISFKSATRLTSDLLKLGVISEITGFSRNKLFVLKDYLDLFRK